MTYLGEIGVWLSEAGGPDGIFEFFGGDLTVLLGVAREEKLRLVNYWNMWSSIIGIKLSDVIHFKAS